jgi:hypothetical protein
LKEHRVIVEDTSFQLAQRRRWIEPEFLPQYDPERLGSP